MKILVPVKRVVDYNIKIRIKSDGSGVELANVKMSMNPFDEIARRGGAPPEGGGQGDRGRGRVDRAGSRRARRIRTALAMGADRGILVKTDAARRAAGGRQDPQGRGRRGEPGLVILGKQAIDDDWNQTGQMLAALTGYGQGTFASKVVVGDGSVEVTREVDGGLQTVVAEASGDRHRRPAPQRAALRLAPQHHEGEEEADRREDPGRLRRRRRAAAQGAEDVGALGGRKAGVKVKTVAELVAKLHDEAGVI